MELLLDLRRKRLEFFGEKRDMLQTHPNRRIHIAFHFQRENTRTNRQRLKMLNPTMAAMANIAMHAFVILAQRKNITVNDVRRSYRSAKVKVLEFGTAHRVSFSRLFVDGAAGFSFSGLPCGAFSLLLGRLAATAVVALAARAAAGVLDLRVHRLHVSVLFLG
ncbi:hypothetical protein [Azonexus hydrophilus]|uniref:Uncharacterized protein n=1 Tax=Azonexus hydrophilus TaxID=418702 RepID=A0ABZ2XKY6_9RHOO